MHSLLPITTISFVATICLLTTSPLATAQATTLDVRCNSGSVHFSDLRYTPCGELAKQVAPKKCVSSGACTLNAKSTPCVKYVKNYPQLIYQCSRKSAPSNGQRAAGAFGGFQTTIGMCSGGTDLVRRAVDAHKKGPKNRRNQYRIPSEEDKIAVRGLIRSIRLQQWNNVKAYSGRMGAVACRLVISGDDILVIEPGSGGSYNGIVLYFRLNAKKPLILEAAHANLEGPDSGTLEQSARLFQKSKIMAALIPGYARWSSATKDMCQPGRFITDNAHSTENLFFHAEVGFKESFSGSRHIQLHRWTGKFDMLVSQAIDAPAKSTGFLNMFAKSVQQSAGANFFKTFRTAASSPGSVFQTNKNTLANGTPGGRLLNGSPRVCQTGSRFAGERFLHIEQTGPSITNTDLWVKSLNKVMDTALFKSADVFNAKEIASAGGSTPDTPAIPPSTNSCGAGKTFNKGKCVDCAKEIKRFLKSQRPTKVRQRLERDCMPKCNDPRGAVINFKCTNCDAVLAAYRKTTKSSTRQAQKSILERIRNKGKCNDIPLSQKDCGSKTFNSKTLKCE